MALSKPAVARSAAIRERPGISSAADERDWLGRKGSNLRMLESKSSALPLGDAPKGPAGGKPARRAPYSGKPGPSQTAKMAVRPRLSGGLQGRCGGRGAWL